MGSVDQLKYGNCNIERSYGVFSWNIAENIVCGDKVFAAFYGLDPEAVDKGVPIEALLERIVMEDVGRIAQKTHHSIVTGAPFEEKFSIHRPRTGIVTVEVYSNCFHRIGDVLTRCAGSIFLADARKAQRRAGEKAGENVSGAFQHSDRNVTRQNDGLVMVAPTAPKPS